MNAKLFAFLALLSILHGSTHCHPLLQPTGDAVMSCDLDGGDPSNSCTSDQTCCREAANGGWGCCFLPNATCCPDQLHCCPHGYHCDPDGSCFRNNSTLPMKSIVAAANNDPMIIKQSAVEVSKELNVFCPNRNYQCDNGETCCSQGNDAYGCCKSTNAFCCPDKRNCCPHGYTICNKDGTCSKPPTESSLNGQDANKIDAISIKKANIYGNHFCPDHRTECLDDATCCQIDTDGHYGCCPFKDAVCCGMNKHCCPTAHVCENGTGTCKPVGVPLKLSRLLYPVNRN
jgi:hypothetical protein